MKKQKVLAALSGGVDSAVMAALLLEQGYDVIGGHMRLLPGEQSLQGEQEAAQVAAELGIPFHSFDCREAFSTTIMTEFCHEYRVGRTPNPCVRCNQQFKFGHLLHMADTLEAEWLATGHYARLSQRNNRPILCRGRDQSKDQSYFLFVLGEAQLQRVLFPLGDLLKSEVRELATRFGLSARKKSESQDICFVPDNDYIAFLESQGNWPGRGEIRHINGQLLGHHQGTHRYTIGQRKGLGIGWSEPLYVVAIDAAAQQIIVAEKSSLQRRELVVEDVVWSHPMMSSPLRVDCRIRYRHHRALATVTPNAQGGFDVLFDEPQSGITPGQCAVFYDEDCVLGGGWIAS